MKVVGPIINEKEKELCGDKTEVTSRKFIKENGKMINVR